MTINEIIDRVHNNNYQLNIIFLPGIHYVHETRKSKWMIDPASEIIFKGIENNATIFCKKSFIFILVHIKHLEMSGIHFQNCSGWYKNQYNSLTLFFIAHKGKNVSILISLTNIQITSKNCEGILAKFKEGNYSFSIINSEFSTGNNGVRVYKDYMNQAAHKAHVNIMNVIFNTSCLLMEHSRFSINNFSVANAIFFGC